MSDAPFGKETMRRLVALVSKRFWFLQDADRQDIVGDVLMTFSRKYVAKDPPRDLDRWLAGAVHRRRVQWYRDHGRRLQRALTDRPAELASGDGGARTPDPVPPVRDHVASEAILDELASHLTPEETRDVQDMLGDESQADVARRLGVSKDRVARRWEKTKEKLRRVLGSGD